MRTISIMICTLATMVSVPVAAQEHVSTLIFPVVA